MSPLDEFVSGTPPPGRSGRPPNVVAGRSASTVRYQADRAGSPGAVVSSHFWTRCAGESGTRRSDNWNGSEGRRRRSGMSRTPAPAPTLGPLGPAPRPPRHPGARQGAVRASGGLAPAGRSAPGRATAPGPLWSLVGATTCWDGWPCAARTGGAGCRHWSMAAKRVRRRLPRGRRGPRPRPS